MESPRTLISARRHGEALANREIRKLSISGRLLLALNRLQRQSCMRLSRFIRCVSFSGLNLMGEAGRRRRYSQHVLPVARQIWGSMVNDGVAHSSDINAFIAAESRAGPTLTALDRRLQARHRRRSERSLLFCILPENLWNNPLHRAFFSCWCPPAVSTEWIRPAGEEIVEMSADPNSPLPDLSYECLAIRASVSGARLLCDRELLRFHQRHPGNDFSQLPLINLLES
uniref:ACPS domain-containing protein n=1 Tax=Macrostomum lignano TaxID=282301 RepID=A0A1I8FMQ5_9PLAT